MNGSDVLAEHDPAFLRARRRERGGIIVLGGLAIIALIVAVLAIVGTIKTETKITKLQPRVTKIERTPCTRDPNGDACQSLRAEIEEQANQRVTCIPFHKAGYPCPIRGSEFLADDGSSPSGGDASAGSTGTFQPGSEGGGSGGGVGTGKQRGGGEGGSGSGKGKTPASSPGLGSVPSESRTSSTSPGRSSDAPGNPEPPAGASRPLPSTLEAAGGVVKEAAEGVGGAVEGVGKGVDCALRGGC